MFPSSYWCFRVNSDGSMLLWISESIVMFPTHPQILSSTNMFRRPTFWLSLKVAWRTGRTGGGRTECQNFAVIAFFPTYHKNRKTQLVLFETVSDFTLFFSMKGGPVQKSCSVSPPRRPTVWPIFVFDNGTELTLTRHMATCGPSGASKAIKTSEW